MAARTDRHAERRGFPNYSWAWPRGGTETLIRAAAWTNEDAAADLFRAWMAETDFDDITFVEQRLLMPIAERFPEERVTVPNRPRLTGVQRMLWSKSRLAIAAAAPAFEKLRQADIKVLVFKGAARAAVDMEGLRKRIAHDVDILVPRQAFPDALRLLTEDGWQPSNGCSSLYCQAVAPAIRGLNLFRGQYGDIDLHQRVLHQYTVLDEAEAGIWQRAREVSFLNGTVHVADPTDALIIAIAHGGLDGHNHSDWIVDSATLVAENAIDWDLFLDQCRQYRIMPHAAIVLSFLAERLEADIPSDVLRTVLVEGRQSKPALYSALFQSHPKRQHNAFGLIGRGISKQWRLYRTRSEDRKASPYLSDIRLRRKRHNTIAAKDAETGQQFSFPLPEGTAGSASFTIAIDAAPVRRRYVFELNTDDRHIARFSIRHNGEKAPLVVSGTCRLPDGLSPGNEALTLSARPSKCFAGGFEGDDEATYGAPRFRVVTFDIN